MHTDLLTLYKLIHKKIDCSLINTFKFNNTVNTRGHAYKLVKESFRVDCRKYSFTCRVINLWNSLSNEIVCCNTVNQFVHKLRAYDLSNFIRGQPFA